MQSLEPYKRVLDATAQRESDDTSASWRRAMEAALLDSEVPLKCVIGDTQMRLRELMRLSPGDVIDISMQELHQVTVGHLPVFSARLGDSRGKFALEFEDMGSLS